MQLRNSSRGFESNATQWPGTDVLELTYKTAAGALGQQVTLRTCSADGKVRVIPENARTFKLDQSGVAEN